MAATTAGAAGWLGATVRFEGRIRRLRTRLEAAREQAHRDSLTGLLNRAGMEAAYRRLARKGGPLVVCLVDLDGFKPVNDTLGHATGDLVLMFAAARLREYASSVGGVAVRLGGDEFALIAPTSADVPMVQVAAHARKALTGEPVRLPGCRDITVRASVGATVLPAGDELADALDAADRAMYHAKTTGSGIATAPTESLAGGEGRPVVRVRDAAHGRPLGVVPAAAMDVKEAS